jgi:hypothetical protein
MKSQKQFILDTLLPYKNNPATCAIDGVKCTYLTEDGRKCAVGKHMKKGKWQNSIKSPCGLDSSFGLDNILKKRAVEQGFTIFQWSSIQMYHDYVARNMGRSTINHEVKRLEESLGIELTELKFQKQ